MRVPSISGPRPRLMIFALMRSPYVKLSRCLTIAVCPPPITLTRQGLPQAPPRPQVTGASAVREDGHDKASAKHVGYLYHFLSRGFCPLLPQCTTTDLPTSSGIGARAI